MKKSLLSFLLIFSAITSFGQPWWGINFDGNAYLDRVSCNPASTPACIWQIGRPSKTVFTSAYSNPNAMVTDTLSPVPANTTSSFFLLHQRFNFVPFHIFALKFMYQLDGDSTDFGTIEISPDNGLNWINMLTQDSVYHFVWVAAKPVLRGSTTGWQKFNVHMDEWASGWGTFPIAMTADTIRFRFTYTTDNNTTLHDGWVIDDIELQDWWEGIQELQNNNLVSIYPNPAADFLSISLSKISPHQTIQILDYSGKIEYENKSFTGNYIDIRQLENGIYFLKYSNTKEYSFKKFVVNH